MNKDKVPGNFSLMLSRIGIPPTLAWGYLDTGNTILYQCNADQVHHTSEQCKNSPSGSMICHAGNIMGES